MLRARRRFRVWALLWALLQCALPLGATYADAAAASQEVAAGVTGHVEDGPGTRCTPPHAADCAICRYLSTHVAGDAVVVAPRWPTARMARPAAAPARHALAASIALPLSRAPPAV